ncbi:MAG: hypothetical protein AAF170_07485 [Bacteroidota bacterium]
MTRIVSFLLLLTVGLGASSELAWAETMTEVNLEMNGTDLPPSPETAEAESSDETVFLNRTRLVIASPVAVDATHLRFEGLSDLPLTRPPRG